MKNYFLFPVYFFFLISYGQDQLFRLSDLIDETNGEANNFYNLIITENKDLYVSSDQGVFKINGLQLIPINTNIKRWAKYDYKTDKFKESSELELKNDLELYFDWLGENYKYQLIDQKLLVYEKSIFKKYLDGISIRIITEDFIGTYNGVYTKSFDLIADYPTYTNSFIRKVGDETYVLFDGIFIDNGVEKRYLFDRDKGVIINELELGFAKDISILNDYKALLTSKGLWLTDLDSSILIDESTRNDRMLNAKIIYKYPDDNRILYLLDGKLKIIDVNYKISNVLNIDDEIIDAYKMKESEDILVLGVNKVYRIKQNKPILLANNDNDYHTILGFKNNVILSSNNGLYSLKNYRLNQLSFEEFNRLALHVSKDSIYAGTIFGLFAFSKKAIENYKTKEIINNENFVSDYFIYLTVFILSIMVVYLLIIVNKKKPVITYSNEISADLVKKNIIENISKITVEKLKSEHGMSYRKLTKLLNNPPGKVIEDERKRKLHELKNQGLSIKKISQQTGYSEDYVRRLRKK